MSLDMEREKEQAKVKAKALDEVDFSSGFETQYAQEYRPLQVLKVQPSEALPAWYRDLNSLLMVLFLFAVLVGGSLLLICFVFTSDPLGVILLLATYFAVALLFIWLELCSKHVR